MQITRQYYNDTQMTDSNSLAAALLSRPEELSPVITHLAGREDKRFPLTMLTEGVGNVRSIDKGEYEYRVNTRLNRTRPLSATTSTANAGLGGSTFVVTFPDKWFVFPYTIVSQSGVQARIMAQPVPSSSGHGYDYTLQLVNPDPTAIMPAADLKAGALFGELWANVGTDFSRGNASNWAAPGLVRHKIGTFRKSYQFSGLAKDFVAEFSLPTKSGQTKLWMEYEEYQYMLQWKEECELSYWYGEQTYDENGQTLILDENNQPVVMGPGILQQIINKDTYSTLTADKIKSIVRDLFFGMTDAQNMQVTLYTGTGGMDEFDRAMKDELGSQTYVKVSDRHWVSGSGRNLQLGGFFTSYQHIDGHVINVVKVPMFDHGPIADSSKKHPVSGLPLESYRMVFVDQSTYDGQANLQMINRKGREFVRWAVAGSVIPRGFTGNQLRASDIDGASVHFLKTGGVVLRRFDTSLDLRCVAA